MRNICILGSTGSIGTQSLEVIEALGERVLAIAGNRNIGLLERQARKFGVGYVACFEEDCAKALRIKLKDTHTRVLSGMQGLCEIASLPQCDLVLNSVVGMVGLLPTLAAINAQKTVALANKETLVAGGALVMEAARANGVAILPVDSEHSAIFQCMQGQQPIQKILLTASGGPFFGKTKGELANITPAQALKHPNWSMGAKITIDSATLMNKGLEVIEAVWLFGIKPQNIEIVVHRESVVHSLVEFEDYSVIGQLGVPDMKIPIQYALTYPKRLPCAVKRLSLTDYGTLHFDKPDYETFQALGACIQAIGAGGLAPCAANAANEVAVELFLQEKIPFLKIGEIVAEAVIQQKNADKYSIDDILQNDLQVRQWVRAHYETNR